MAFKKSKVKIVQANGTWSPKDKPDTIYYKNEVEFENGDIGEYSSIKQDQDKFIEGQETEYEYIDGKYPKVKPVYQQPKSFGGGFKDEGGNREERISRWAGLGRAIDYLHGTKPTEEQLYQQAERFIDWVNKKPKQTNTSNTAKAMHDFAKNPTGNNNNDDLPF